MKSSDVAIVWLRKDLRLSDQPALHAAARAHHRILPLYIWSPEDDGEWAPGAASRWWLADSLVSLKKSLELAGSGLIIRKGQALSELLDIVALSKAKFVYLNHLYEPAARQRDDDIFSRLRSMGIALHCFNGSLLADPRHILNKSGTPYLVYGAFWRRFQEVELQMPTLAMSELPPLPASPEVYRSLLPSDLALKPEIPWDAHIKKTWQVGESEAFKKLGLFRRGCIENYAASRDIPSSLGTSRLSPHLHFGEISPRQVWFDAKQGTFEVTTYLKQLVWREFSYYLLFHYPHIAEHPLRAEFKDFPWEGTPSHLKAWQQGLTGYPIVDAGMRELWHSGWMHNRVRMIVASFLVKDLRIHWLEGAKWFWDTLLDADLANNTQGWQWTSGCGADASPFFRVFNPVLQGKKFDPEGLYVKKWLPELASLPPKLIHTPWEAKKSLDYPDRIVDHDAARFSVLKAYDDMRRMNQCGVS